MSEAELPRPSATIVLLRDNAGQLETLMLQKNRAINYGGSWVFPGGVIDREDYQIAEQTFGDANLENTARVAAARESFEEAGLTLKPESFTPFAHWITPKMHAKRYATWFFACDANAVDEDVVIDDGEIVAARWISPAQALAEQANGIIMLNGPSYVTLSELQHAHDTSSAIANYQLRDTEFFEPRGFVTDTGVATLYHGDHAYDLSELNQQSAHEEVSAPLHRLYMHKQGAWHYYRKPKPTNHCKYHD
jgi:8-oxo-dGTP pyrophosphatase MutT (NUDIX family)